MSKQKFDLSNVGGQPKDWAQRSREAEIEGGIGLRNWAKIAIIAICGLGVLASLAILGVRILS